MNIMQESLCADAASFDLPSWLLTACISEAKNCIDLSITRREESNDKSRNPDNFAILKGKHDLCYSSNCQMFIKLYFLIIIIIMNIATILSLF